MDSMPLKTNLLTVTLCIFVLESCITAADWTQYRGPRGDGKSSETLNVDDFLTGMKTPLWKAETNKGFSSFAVGGNAVYTIITREKDGENRETCVALDQLSGKELWAVPLSSSEYSQGGGDAGAPGNRGGDGARNTPTFDQDRVYIYDGHLLLTCLDAKSGTIHWQRDVINEFNGRNIRWYNASSPVIAGELVLVSGGGPGETFLAFDKNNGEMIWKSGDELMTHATPHLATINGTRQIIFFMQSGLVALDIQKGQELWRSEFPYSVSTAASPVINGDKVYCSAGYGVGAGLFQITENNQAEELWFQPNKLMNHWSTPIIHDGHLYGIYEFKKYGRAPLKCIDLATGEIKWSHPGFGPGNVILAGDKLVVLSDAGEVALVSAQPDAYHELGRVQAIEGKCWSTPALSDGKLYIRSTTQGACFDLKPKK